MEYKREGWNDYSSRLTHYGYTTEQIEIVKEIREGLEQCPWEQYQELIKMGILVRTRKLKKARSILTDGQKFYYLDHYVKAYRYSAEFKNEETE